MSNLHVKMKKSSSPQQREILLSMTAQLFYRKVVTRLVLDPLDVSNDSFHPHKVSPTNVFSGNQIFDIQTNPGDTPELVAILRGENPNAVIEVVDIKKNFTVCSWSSNGRLIITSSK